MRGQFKVWGIVSLVILIVFFNNVEKAPGYIIEGDMGRFVGFVEGMGEWVPSIQQWEVEVLYRDFFIFQGHFRVISEFGNTQPIDANFILHQDAFGESGNGDNCFFTFVPLGSLSGDSGIYTTEPPHARIGDTIDIGSWYVVFYLTGLYGGQFTNLQVIDPTQRAVVDASGRVEFTFELVLPPESPPVPEPATMLLLGSGLIGLVGYWRKKFFKK